MIHVMCCTSASGKWAAQVTDTQTHLNIPLLVSVNEHPFLNAKYLVRPHARTAKISKATAEGHEARGGAGRV